MINTLQNPQHQAVRTIYYDGQAKKSSVTSFLRVVNACRALGMDANNAKIATLSLVDYAWSKQVIAKLLADKLVTQEQIDASKF